MIKKVLLIVRCRFSIDLFALKKCRILHIKNLTSSKNNSGIKLFMNIALINLILSTILKYEIKIKVSDVNFEI